MEIDPGMFSSIFIEKLVQLFFTPLAKDSLMFLIFKKNPSPAQLNRPSPVL
jgi:hypothetical protein